MFLERIVRLTKLIHCPDEFGAFDRPIVSEKVRRVAADQVRNIVGVVGKRERKVGVLRAPDMDEGVVKDLQEGVPHIVWNLDLGHGE